MNDPLIWSILLPILLIFISGFFAAAASALEALNAAKVRADAENGSERAQKLAQLIDEPERFRMAVQIAATLCSCLAAALLAQGPGLRITLWLMDTLGMTAPGGTVWFWVNAGLAVVLVFLMLVLGVLAPTRIGARKPEPVVKVTVPVVQFFAGLFRPFIALMNLAVTGVLKLLGLNGQSESDNVTEEEFRMMLDASEEEGLIESTEGEMIDNIFEFNNIQIYDVMTHRVDVEVIDVEASREEITETIRRTGYSRFPVYEEEPDHIIGILYVKDFFLNQDTPIREILKEAVYVPDTMICDDLFHKMQKERFHFAIVTDEYGSFLGITTLEDLLEEIVGNIYDEYDKKRDYILPNPDGSWTISGRTELKDIEKALDIELTEQDDFNTLGGLVLSVTSEIPKDGSQFEVEVDGLHIKVLRVLDRRIEDTRVTLLPRDVNEEEK